MTAVWLCVVARCAFTSIPRSPPGCDGRKEREWKKWEEEKEEEESLHFQYYYYFFCTTSFYDPPPDQCRAADPHFGREGEGEVLVALWNLALDTLGGKEGGKT